MSAASMATAVTIEACCRNIRNRIASSLCSGSPSRRFGCVGH